MISVPTLGSVDSRGDGTLPMREDPRGTRRGDPHIVIQKVPHPRGIQGAKDEERWG